MTYSETQSFIEWCRIMGAVRVQVGDVAVDFAGRPPTAAPQPKKLGPDDDDGEELSAEEREKKRKEKYMFWSSQ